MSKATITLSSTDGLTSLGTRQHRPPPTEIKAGDVAMLAVHGEHHGQQDVGPDEGTALTLGRPLQ